MRHSLIFCALLTLAPSIALAAPVPPQSPAVATSKPAEPERLALAREIARAFWPDGMMQEMMSSMSGMQSGMMKGMFDKTPKDLGVEGGKDSDKTLGQVIREKDPHFEERMAITNKVMMEEMGKIMGDLEPQMREAIAGIYAKRFTVGELRDIATFFRTPSGKNFGRQMIPMMADPDYVSAMTAVMPKVMQAMPGIAEKIKKATAHLPEPSKDDEAEKAELPST